MKLLLDTTYFLPVIGISIKGIPKDTVVRLMKRGHEILVSEITIFELLAKGARYAALGVLSTERILRGIRALLYDERIYRVPIYDTVMLLTAFRIRKLLNDFIDCLILASAINQAEVLVTEDENILELFNAKEFQELIRELNPKFKIKRLKDVIESIE